MRLKANLTLPIVSIFLGSAFIAQRVVYLFNGAPVLSGWLVMDERLTGFQIFGCVLIFVAVLLSQFKEWNLQGKIDSTHLVEGR